MTECRAFGDEEHYYAGSLPSPFDPDADIMRLIKRILGRGLKGKVSRICKVWSQMVRDHLSNKSRLKLGLAGETTEPVRVQVVDGLPPVVRELVGPGRDGVSWELVLNRWLFLLSKRGLHTVLERWDGVAKLLGQLPAGRAEVENVSKLLKDLCEKIPRNDIGRRILALPVDPLGAYFYKERVIQIYWMSIGIVGRNEGMDVEDLTLIVLAHELAHAFTHVGYDIDREQWDTDAFARADSRIVEGLAQFYASGLCDSLRERRPSLRSTFDRMMCLQPIQYRAHLDWGDPNEAIGEVVRRSTVECRSKRTIHYEEFLDIIAEARQEYGPREQRGRPKQKPVDLDFDPKDDGEEDIWPAP